MGGTGAGAGENGVTRGEVDGGNDDTDGRAEGEAVDFTIKLTTVLDAAVGGT